MKKKREELKVICIVFALIVSASKVDCYDYNNSGSHEIIGSFQATLCQIQQASQTFAVRLVWMFMIQQKMTSAFFKSLKIIQMSCVYFPQAEFECINSHKKQKKRSYKNSGVIIIKQCKVQG